MNAQLVKTAFQHLVPSEIRRSLTRKKVLILGAGQLAKELGRVLVAKRDAYEVIGFLHRDVAEVGERLFIIGTYEQLFELVERYRVSTIAVCLDDRRDGLPLQTLLDFKTMGLEIKDGHQFFEEEAGRFSIDLLKPSTLIFSEGFRRPAVTMGVKRLIDVLASVAGLLALTPLFAVVALLIRRDSPGPVFYKQTRVGRRGEPYQLYKFRSMRQDAEAGGIKWAEQEDPRITGIGRWIRKWRVDELPQLINVLKGEMSLVGPRPERPAFVQQLRRMIPYYDLRHTVRPGLTGWAQIRFRYAASIEDAHVKLQYDLYYLKNLSVGLDCRILLGTIPVILQGSGAR